MVIVMYDGNVLECSKVEFSNKTNDIIVDDYKVVPIIEILRIITKPAAWRYVGRMWYNPIERGIMNDPVPR